MIYLVDGLKTSWQRISEAIMLFGSAARTNSVYCYLLVPHSLEREGSALCRSLSIEDYCTILQPSDELPEVDVRVDLSSCSTEYVKICFNSLVNEAVGTARLTLVKAMD
jgi:hypothetical protein